MLTFGVIGAIVTGSVLIERRCRDRGNTDGALAAKRFGRLFLAAAGGWIVVEWIGSMLTLLTL